MVSVCVYLVLNISNLMSNNYHDMRVSINYKDKYESREPLVLDNEQFVLKDKLFFWYCNMMGSNGAE